MDVPSEAWLVWRDAVAEWAWVRSTENEKKMKAAKKKWEEEWRCGLTPAAPDAADRGSNSEAVSENSQRG
jgi:hypothetical protein